MSTENGDKAFTTSTNACLDFFTRIVRNADIKDYLTAFNTAWAEDIPTAIQLLYNLRDIRSGKGEKLIPAVILTCLKIQLSESQYEAVLKQYIEYGCWKDVLKIMEMSVRFNNNIKNTIEVKLFSNQLQQDYDILNTSTNNKENKNVAISLCAKWAPSEKMHYNNKPICAATQIAKFLHLNPKQYRLMLTSLRKHLNVLEMLMATQQFDKIDFSKLPSIAFMKMKHAFNRDTNANFHQSDERKLLHTSYETYLTQLKAGNTKVNVKGIQPHELVSTYFKSSTIDDLVEEQWKTIKADIKKSGVFRDVSAIVDVSSSMDGQPMEVAIALGILVAECTEGPFYGNLITFHEYPTWLKLTGNTLLEQVKCVKSAQWGGSTNLRAVFDMILQNAISANLTNEEMIKTLFIFTDMQFNQCDFGNWQSTFEYMQNLYTQHGYNIPKIVCWNLCTSGSKTVPVLKNEQGFVMLSGFSNELLKAVLSADLEQFTPLNMMLHVLEPYIVPDVIANLSDADVYILNGKSGINGKNDNSININELKKAVDDSKFKQAFKAKNNK